MTFQELAEIVAQDFLDLMEDEGFDTFKELKESYGWTWEDIKDEIDSSIDGNSISMNIFMYMSDNRRYIQIEDKRMNWGEFKKLVFAIVNAE